MSMTISTSQGPVPQSIVTIAWRGPHGHVELAGDGSSAAASPSGPPATSAGTAAGIDVRA